MSVDISFGMLLMVLDKLSNYIYYNVVFCHEYEDDEAVMISFDYNFDSGRRKWGRMVSCSLVNHVPYILLGGMRML
jgi:hypothetical protein